MNLFLEALRAALTSLMAHRLRSFLTTLGILIGTASVIAVVSLVQGFSELIKAQFADIGGARSRCAPKTTTRISALARSTTSASRTSRHCAIVCRVSAPSRR
ncbi:MAG: ABC transporter permease [Ahniella sp.]|nr:ABC transporter permease [Ahniella sp.]